MNGADASSLGPAEDPLFAVVLAAGRGTRMGGPKALVRVDGVTLAERHAARLVEAGCARVVIVVPPDAHAELANAHAFRANGVRLVSAVTESQAATLAVGLGVLATPASKRADAHATYDVGGPGRPDVVALDALVVVTPVDMLPASAATIARLVAVLRASAALDAATPTYGGRGGHPAVVRHRALVDPTHPHSLPLRDRLRALGGRRLRIDVDDRAVTADFDTPLDLPA